MGGGKSGGGQSAAPVTVPAVAPARAPEDPAAKGASATVNTNVTDKKAAAAAKKSLFFDSQTLGTGGVNPVSVLARTLGGV